ncbi:hypothetical protein KO489_04080, partial [Reinekea forsetii]|nr:hypothetical protein [Reinekea forsetii]
FTGFFYTVCSLVIDIFSTHKRPHELLLAILKIGTEALWACSFDGAYLNDSAHRVNRYFMFFLLKSTTYEP